MGNGAWQATVHRITESDMTEPLTPSLALLFVLQIASILFMGINEFFGLIKPNVSTSSFIIFSFFLSDIV